MYYVDGDFMSRNHIEQGQIAPLPVFLTGHILAAERSIGQTETDELAVMVDTFKPLKVTRAAIDLIDGDYHQSWLD